MITLDAPFAIKVPYDKNLLESALIVSLRYPAGR